MKDLVKNILLAGLGGAIGTMIRAGLYASVKSFDFPYTTGFINITGSFCIGVVAALVLRENGLSQDWRVFLATGICGGFTTFSAFSLENLELLRKGQTAAMLFYSAGSVILGVMAAYVGYRLFTK